MAMLEITDNLFEAADDRRITTTLAVNQSTDFDCLNSTSFRTLRGLG